MKWINRLLCDITGLSNIAGIVPVICMYISILKRFNVNRATLLLGHKLLNKQSNNRWFHTPWRSCDVIVMIPTMTYVVRTLRPNTTVSYSLLLCCMRYQVIVFVIWWKWIVQGCRHLSRIHTNNYWNGSYLVVFCCCFVRFYIPIPFKVAELALGQSQDPHPNPYHRH